jgi:hypothetical protein
MEDSAIYAEIYASQLVEDAAAETAGAETAGAETADAMAESDQEVA